MHEENLNALNREYEKLQSELKSHSLKERKLIHIAIIVISALLGTTVTALGIITNSTVEFLTPMQGFILTLIAILPLVPAINNYREGDYIALFTSMVIVVTVTSVNPIGDSYLILITDALVMFCVSNSFGIKGFAYAGTILTTKILFVYLNMLGDRTIVGLISQLITIYMIGVLPVILNYIARLSKINKISGLKAEILAHENEVLINQWKGTSNESNRLHIINPDKENTYVSPYNN